MTDSNIPRNVIKRILRETEEGCRVGDDAILVTEQAAQVFIRTIAKEALTYTKHAGRKTLRAEDILIAVERLSMEIVIPKEVIRAVKTEVKRLEQEPGENPE